MEYNGIGEKNYQIMKNYLKKKDDHSFKKFVAVRGDIIKVITDNMRLWISNKNEQSLIAKEIEKQFTKENFKDMYFVESFLRARNMDYFFGCMVVKAGKK